MLEAPRRKSIQSIVAQYVLHPELRDLYVEGMRDFDILKWYFEEKGLFSVTIYPVDAIDVGAEIERKWKSKHRGNKSRVIALAEELAFAMGSAPLPARCIVDADFDRHANLIRTNASLLYTDYVSMEMYCLRDSVLRKLAYAIVGNSIFCDAGFMTRAVEFLTRLFFFRLVCLEGGIDLKIVPISKCLRVDKNIIIFDFDEMLAKSLHKCRSFDRLEELRAKIYRLENEAGKDARHNIRGHDFTELLVAVIRQCSSKRFRGLTSEELGAILMACIDIEELSKEALFAEVSRFVSPSANV